MVMKKVFVSSLAIAVLLGTMILPSLGFDQAHATNYTVSSLTDIWLAGQPNGATVSGYFGTDSAFGNSPVQIFVSAGNILTFSASGSTSVDASNFGGPDGASAYPNQYGFSNNSALPNGISSYSGPADALIGVFLGPGVPSGTGVDYGSTSPNMTLLSYNPLLNQIFFIGDGLTGTGTGNIQQFIAPTGATRLFLAVADSVGSSTGNVGSLNVDVYGATQSTVPEPASMLLLGLGLAGLAGFRKKIKRG
jgi:hypothetical protein